MKDIIGKWPRRRRNGLKIVSCWQASRPEAKKMMSCLQRGKGHMDHLRKSEGRNQSRNKTFWVRSQLTLKNSKSCSLDQFIRKGQSIKRKILVSRNRRRNILSFKQFQPLLRSTPKDYQSQSTLPKSVLRITNVRNW